MPILGSKPVKRKTTKEKPSKVALGEGERDVRLVCKDKDSGDLIYVIEVPPGRRGLSYQDNRYTLWWPWTYFFVKVGVGEMDEAAKTSLEAPAYVMVARKRLGINENGLMIPYLPNLFGHGGICPNHDNPITGKTTLEAARNFLRWFAFANGNSAFGKVTRPKFFGAGNMFGLLAKWSKLPPEKVLAVDWQPARYPSILKAALSLRFEYWTFDRVGINDMIRKKSNVKRKVIGGTK